MKIIKDVRGSLNFVHDSYRSGSAVLKARIN